MKLHAKPARLLALVVCCCIINVGCGYDGPKFSVSELNEALENRARKITVVDVRPKVLFEKGHISGAINIPLEEVDKQAATISKMEGELAVVCNCGRNALVAIKQLAEKEIVAGLVLGGMIAWESEGFPVEKGKK